MSRTPPSDPDLRLGTRAGRLVLLVTVVGSGMALLDSTVVSIALPVIGTAFHVDVAGLQWIVNGYMLTLAGLLLLGGVLGDRYGRRRVYLVGVAWFAVASLGCALAPNATVLVTMRVLQGIGGALLTPGGLAILQSTFAPDERGRAIGAWSGLSGVATAIGPFLGGWLIAAVSWRLIFLINVPVAVLLLGVAPRVVPETWDPGAPRRVDLIGAVLATGGLVGLTYGLIEGPGLGFDSAGVLASLVLGATALVAFGVAQTRSSAPLVPVEVFASRQFVAANAVTFLVYGALGGAFFLLPVDLEQVAGYSALEAGASLLPVTVLMLVFSRRFGALATRIGPRLPMGLGPLVAAGGLALLGRIDASGSFLLEVLPAVVVFGFGLSVTVAPLTTTVLAAAPATHAGAASAINNDVARAASLIAVAVLPAAAGISGSSYLHPVAFSSGFHLAAYVAAAACAAGGALALATIRNAPADALAEASPAPV